MNRGWLVLLSLGLIGSTFLSYAYNLLVFHRFPVLFFPLKTIPFIGYALIGKVLYDALPRTRSSAPFWLAGRDMRRGIPAAGRGMPEHNRIRQLCALADSGQPAGPARVDRVFQCGAPASRGATARTDARFPPARAAQLRGLPDTPVPDLAPETVLENRSALVCRTGPAPVAGGGVRHQPRAGSAENHRSLTWAQQQWTSP